MHVGVTGASGFIGRHLTAALGERGDVVTAVKRPYHESTLMSVFGRTDAIVHLAGLVAAVRDEAYISANVESTRTIARCAAQCSVPLIHISSLAAAGPASFSSPHTEGDPACPITPYGRSKLEGEEVVRGVNGLVWVLLRPGVVYGPGDRALLPLFRYAGHGILPWAGNPAACYTFIYVHDLVAALVAAIDRRPAGRTIFLGHAAPVTAREILEAIKAATGGRAAIVRVPDVLARLAAAAGDVAGKLTGRPATLNSPRYREMASVGFVCRVDRMRETLGVVAHTGLHEGMTATAEWYKNEGWIR